MQGLLSPLVPELPEAMSYAAVEFRKFHMSPGMPQGGSLVQVDIGQERDAFFCTGGEQ